MTVTAATLSLRPRIARRAYPRGAAGIGLRDPTVLAAVSALD